ncbi:MAG: acyl carrier protein [Deltaproteobacteria bacterium]|nr:acyl carrier protein [Deltaproteobacteria bacterium]
MDRNEIIEKLRTIVLRNSQSDLGQRAVSEQDRIDSLGIDSLAMLDLIYDLQQEFGIEMDPQDLIPVVTIGDLVTMIKSRVSA